MLIFFSINFFVQFLIALSFFYIIIKYNDYNNEEDEIKQKQNVSSIRSLVTDPSTNRSFPSFAPTFSISLEANSIDAFYPCIGKLTGGKVASSGRV